MRYHGITAAGVMAFAFAMSGCSREATLHDTTEPNSNLSVKEDRAADERRQREHELSILDDRVSALDRHYREDQEKRAARPTATAGARTAGRLREDVTSDVDDVKNAVEGLRTTTVENWWTRHESAMKKAADDVEGDVRDFTRTRTLPPAQKDATTRDAAGQAVSTAPFTSNRDKFVADMRVRIDAMDKALDNVKATGPRKTELDDLRARVKKLGDDVDRLKSASAEEWWNISKDRVSDYIARVEKSVGRLDDNKR